MGGMPVFFALGMDVTGHCQRVLHKSTVTPFIDPVISFIPVENVILKIISHTTDQILQRFRVIIRDHVPLSFLLHRSTPSIQNYKIYPSIFQQKNQPEQRNPADLSVCFIPRERMLPISLIIPKEFPDSLRSDHVPGSH